MNEKRFRKCATCLHVDAVRSAMNFNLEMGQVRRSRPDDDGGEKLAKPKRDEHFLGYPNEFYVRKLV